MAHRHCKLVFFALSLLAAVTLYTNIANASPIYNGGPVMNGTNTVYYLWYGNWTGNTATSILPNLITNLSGTSYMNILSSYDRQTTNFSNRVNYGGSYYVSSTQNSSIYNTYGTSIDGTTNTDIHSIISAALTNGAFSGYNPSSSIIDVLTASSISVKGFYSIFCGWHSSTNFGNNTLGTQYGFIGDPIQGQGCNLSSQDAPSANNNFGADAMASVISHELFETITDPTGTAWWDSTSPSGYPHTGGFENGDMCNFNFGSTFTTSNNANANVTLHGTNYLLQQQWINQGGGTNYSGGVCATSLPVAVPEPNSLGIMGIGVFALSMLGLSKIKRKGDVA